MFLTTVTTLLWNRGQAHRRAVKSQWQLSGLTSRERSDLEILPDFDRAPVVLTCATDHGWSQERARLVG